MTNSDSSTARPIESPLFESVRQSVLRELPVDPNDTTLVEHLEAKDAHGLLVVFYNWQSRFVSAVPRQVHRSTALDRNPLAAQYDDALTAIVTDIETGNSLTKYLSRGVRIAAAVPGDTPSLQRRRDLDLMLNDWGMYHLHLSTEVESDGFVSRTGPLLFIVIRPADAYLLDIMDHGNWTSQHLLEVLVRDFPDSGGFHVMNGVVGLSHEIDEQGRRALRSHSVNSLTMIDGQAVMPTMGMTLAGTTITATRESDRLLEAVEEFEQAWTQNPNYVRELVRSQGNELPEEPDFQFAMHETQGAGFFEPSSGVFFPLFPGR